jgi:vacuolar-type H+-ATPase subunit H
MSQPPHEPEHLLESLLSNGAAASDAQSAEPQVDEDVDSLIDALEALVGEGRRMPFRKLLIDEERLLDLVDRLRSAIPAEVRQAHQVLDQHDQIVNAAREKARALLDERGMLDSLEKERRQMIEAAEQEALRIRTEADRYARSVLLDLGERLAKIQTSVQNGVEALQPRDSTAS